MIGRLIKQFRSPSEKIAEGESVPTSESSSDAIDPGFFVDIDRIQSLPDEELDILNELLPWAAFVCDKNGRSFGAPYSSQKRNTPQRVPDPRIVELDQRYGLKGKKVLEAGCFEGIHTAALCQLGAHVSAFDGRIENVIKTLVRCWAFGVRPNVFFWNLENICHNNTDDISCDILHHVGVLYHLKNPLEHLRFTLQYVEEALMLDTHVAPEGPLERANIDDFEYRYFRYMEAGRTEPFAGLEKYAKWIYLDDLVSFLKLNGFKSIDKCEIRDERNGPRVMICAKR